MNSYQKSLEIQEARLEDDDRYIIDLLQDMARAYKEMGEHTQALEMLRKAVGIREARPDSGDRRAIADLLKESAEVYKEMGDHPKAMEMLHKVFEIFEKLFGPEDDMTRWICGMIADYYREQGDNSKAIEWYRKVIEISQKICDGRHTWGTVISDCEELAQYYRELGDYDEALEWFYRVLVICDKHSDDVDYDVLESIADVHSAKGDNQIAVEWLEKAVECLEAYLRKYAPKENEHARWFEYHEERKEELEKLRAKLCDMKKGAKQ
jgi:tetratricopeptide (TPR) repeat protein